MLNKIVYFIWKYGDAVQAIYVRLKHGYDTADFDAEFVEQVRHWMEVAEGLLRYALQRFYGAQMVAAFGYQTVELSADQQAEVNAFEASLAA
jgi:hypothetical protein